MDYGLCTLPPPHPPPRFPPKPGRNGRKPNRVRPGPWPPTGSSSQPLEKLIEFAPLIKYARSFRFGLNQYVQLREVYVLYSVPFLVETCCLSISDFICKPFLASITAAPKLRALPYSSNRAMCLYSSPSATETIM